MISANTEKLQELILHVCLSSEGDERFGSIKLNKILFYGDFAAYLLLGNSISGQEYQKLPRGPAPRLMLPVLEDMQEKDLIFLAKRDYYGRSQKRPLALRPPNLSLFRSDEIALVDRLIRECWHMDGNEISEQSHKFLGWKLGEEKETIPYGMALLEKRELTDREIAWANELDMSGVEPFLAE